VTPQLLALPQRDEERTGQRPEVSIVIISYNTRDLLRRCLQSAAEEAGTLAYEILVVDNASRDGSAEMVEAEFPQVRLLRSQVNLGFGAANNLALQHASGRYFILLNSDAFFAPGALALAIRHMDETPACGLGGGRLVGEDGSPQPSARCFHTLLNDVVVLTGLAARFPRSRLFGRFDRTWADPFQAAPVDWVPGAFSIVRPEALLHVGLFDPDFFLYYEEVDLCLRLKKAGMQIWYWPDIVITHIGGESSRQLTALEFSSQAAQVVLWRMRSTLLYYRKHHGRWVHAARAAERALYRMSLLRNRFSRQAGRQERARSSHAMLKLMNQAWKDTSRGRISPPRPW
jgi:GT2 family glycosyltransferase